MALKTSPLHEYHLEYGVKMAPVGNWTLPLHFENGIAAEGQQCVDGLALFDLCGSGKFRLAGKATDLDAHFSPAPSALKIGETGRFLQGNCDCVRLLRMAEDDFLMITSPLSPLPSIPAMEVQDLTPIFARLLFVGNNAAELLKNLGADTFPAENHWSKISVDGINAIAFESVFGEIRGWNLLFNADVVDQLWDLLLENEEIEPAGYGALDALRISAGIPARGSELTGAADGIPTVIELEKSRIPRKGTPVLNGEAEIGKVTSGALNPLTGKAVLFALLQQAADTVTVDGLAGTVRQA